MLSQLQAGARGRIIKVNGDKDMVRKFMGLGIKAGCDFELLHRRGDSVVVQSKGTRVAIGGDVARHLQVESLPQNAPAS